MVSWVLKKSNGNYLHLLLGYLRSLLHSVFLCSWDGGSAWGLSGGQAEIRILVLWCTGMEKGAEHLYGWPLWELIMFPSVANTVGAASEGYGVYAKKV